jgi:hypothetical protein
LLLDHGRGGVFAGAGEPGTISRAGDLGEALGAAADRTDLLADGRTAAPGATNSA